jgi:hypothetical protein
MKLNPSQGINKNVSIAVVFRKNITEPCREKKVKNREAYNLS